MTVVLVVGAVIFVGGLLRLRARNKRRLAGLDSNKPAFSVAPPARSLLTRKDHRL